MYLIGMYCKSWENRPSEPVMLARGNKHFLNKSRRIPIYLARISLSYKTDLEGSRLKGYRIAKHAECSSVESSQVTQQWTG